MQRHVAQGAQRQCWRQREAVAGIAKPVSPDRGVDREHEGLVSGRGDTGNKIGGCSAVAPYIQLEPQSPAGHGDRQILDRRGPHRGKGVRDLPSRGNRTDGGLPGVVHESREAGRTEAERLGALPAKRMCDGVQIADVSQNIRNELDVTKQLPRAPEAQLVIGRTVRVVEHGTRGVPASNATQISDRPCFA